MFAFARSAAGWAARHTLPVMAGVVIIGAALGGGLTYALAHSNSPATSSAAAGPAPSGKASKAAGRGTAALGKALALLATDTGQTVDAIKSQLQAGKSINDIAGPAAALKFENDLLAVYKASLDASVASGKVTAAQEAAKLTAATTTLNAVLAEPGTTLLQQGQKFNHFVHGKPSRKAAGPSPTPSPSPVPPA